jgi:hypothetical protein
LGDREFRGEEDAEENEPGGGGKVEKEWGERERKESSSLTFQCKSSRDSDRDQPVNKDQSL